MGIASNKISYWTLIKIIDLEPIRVEYDNLVNNFKVVTSAYNKHENGKGHFREMENFHKLLEYIIKQIKKKFDALDPAPSKRQKRGLINGLGSLIKFVTGNLDSDDAIKYNDAIKNLSNQQNGLKLLMKEQIKLTTTAIDKFNSSIRKLASNQMVLQERIFQIEYIINATNVYKTKSEHKLIIISIYFQLITALNNIKDILEELEETITFGGMKVMHQSILSPEELIEELLEIKPTLTTTKFPVPLEKENYPEFQKLIHIKMFIQNSKIHFILEIPIVELIDYNYYHLYSCPIQKNSVYSTIIPQAKFLLINEQSYALNNQECIEINSNQYMCEFDTNPIEENSPQFH